MRFILAGFILAVLQHTSPIRFIRFAWQFGFEPMWTRTGGYGSFPYLTKASVQTIFSPNYCLPPVVFLYVLHVLK